MPEIRRNLEIIEEAERIARGEERDTRAATAIKRLMEGLGLEDPLQAARILIAVTGTAEPPLPLKPDDIRAMESVLESRVWNILNVEKTWKSLKMEINELLKMLRGPPDEKLRALEKIIRSKGYLLPPKQAAQLKTSWDSGKITGEKIDEVAEEISRRLERTLHTDPARLAGLLLHVPEEDRELAIIALALREMAGYYYTDPDMLGRIVKRIKEASKAPEGEQEVLALNEETIQELAKIAALKIADTDERLYLTKEERLALAKAVGSVNSEDELARKILNTAGVGYSDINDWRKFAERIRRLIETIRRLLLQSSPTP